MNVKKNCLLVIDNDKRRRKQKPAPLLTINGEDLQAINLDDACKYLRYWGMGNGSIRATKPWKGQAKDHCSTWTDQMPSSHIRASNGIVHKQRYRSLLHSGLKVNWTMWNNCASKPTRMLGTCHGQQQVLSLSSQVRKAHCPWLPMAAHGSTNTGVVAACREIHATWGCIKKMLLAGLHRTLDECLCNCLLN